MAERFYTALDTVLAQKGMSVAELADIPGTSNLPYRAEQRSPSVTLKDVYAVSRALGVVPLVAVKEGDTQVIHIDDNGSALRTLRGTQSVAKHIVGKDMSYSAYYEMEGGSRSALRSVIKVWSEFGYSVRFLEPVAPNGTAQVKQQDVSLPVDFMKLNQDQVTELLRRHFPDKS